MEETYKKTRVAIYVRVSTDEQAQKGVSVEFQQESLIEFAKQHNYILNEKRHIYIDRGYSGASKNRPALEKLMFDSQNNEFDLVIVKKVDRFFRKNLYLLQYVEELCQNGVGFKAIDQGFNIEDSSGKMMLSMLGVIGEMERDLIRDRTISGKIQKSKMGYYVGGGHAKLGYRLEHDGKGNKLLIDEEESQVVKRIFHLFVNENKSLGEICRLFNNEGIRTNYDRIFKGKETDRRKTGNYWYAGSLNKLINDEIYIGNYYYGKTGSRFDKKLGKEVEYLKPESERIVMESPRIIDDLTFYKARDLLIKNKATKNNKLPHIFAGLIKCEICGRNYIGYRTGKGTISYKCGGYTPHKTPEELRCFNKQVSELFLIEHIWNKIDEIFKNPKEILEKYYSTNNQNEIFENYRIEFDELLKKIDRYSNGLKNLYKDIYLADNERERELKEETVRTMNEELEQLNHRKIELNAHIVKLKRIDENKGNLTKIVKAYKENFDNLSYENKIELIKEFVEKIVVYENGRLVVFFKFGNNGGLDNCGNGNNNHRNLIKYGKNRNNDNINNTDFESTTSENPIDIQQVNKFNGLLDSTIFTFIFMKKIILFLVIFCLFYSGYQILTISNTEVKIGKYTIEKGDTINNIPTRFKLDINKFFFRIWTKIHYSNFNLQAGSYTIVENTNISQLFSNNLKNPDSLDMEITILPGRNIFDIDEYLSSKGLIKSSDLIKYSEENISELSNKYSFLKGKKTLEGFLFPDTYRFGFDFRLDTFVDKLLETFDKKIFSIYSDNSEKNNFYDKLILASIVEREEKNSDNKKIVAGILQKRIDSKMPIGADATVCYSYQYTQKECTPSFINSVIYKKSPYNTRSQLGLPPTPISNVSKDTIDSVYNSEDSDYFYYLHDNSGLIHYAKNLNDHNNNKNLYLK